MDEFDKRRPPFPGPDRFEIRTQPGVAALSRRRTFNPYSAPARLPVGVQGRSALPVGDYWREAKELHKQNRDFAA